MPPFRQSDRRQASSGSSEAPLPPSRLEGIRTGINGMFIGRSRVGTHRARTPESPKMPRLALGLGNISHSRIALPYLSRSNTIAPPSPTRSEPQMSVPMPISSRTITAQDLQQETIVRPPTRVPSYARHNSHTARRFVGVDSAELHLAELAESGRRRRRNKARGRRPKCFPKVTNKKIRSKILSCFISGLFLLMVLTVYLCLALTNRNESQEFHVLLILIILITTIFFCHALIRLCMMIINPPVDDALSQDLPSMVGPGGYANPTVPIQVALARDEEAAGIENDATKLPPPAYGLWRESVRVDPNRIYWQRNEAAALQRQNSTERREARPSTANRPPSYISENGVDYVLEAEPRSIAPTTDVPMAPHPSERGRVWPMA
ncbi:hypothetical protein LSUE1_G007292 [Lachnellula suecica]|uniref:Uncharacterized protein n=1 Tax=Lachnellula suecica TaxID=602035 RepID=A0A8T9BYD8_9HELO|nr:hypothetical protein LSUE1_G007292 [Lachnellula suecica]